jgi:hypothetical protein
MSKQTRFSNIEIHQNMNGIFKGKAMIIFFIRKLRKNYHYLPLYSHANRMAVPTCVFTLMLLENRMGINNSIF